MAKQTQESILVSKGLASEMVNLFERLLVDFEKLADKVSLQKARARSREIASGKVKALTEKDYGKYKRGRLDAN